MMPTPDFGEMLQNAMAMNVHPPPSAGLLLEKYGTLLIEKPLATKAITAAVLASAGDAVAQFRSFKASLNDDDDGETNPNQKEEESTPSASGLSFYDPTRGLAFLAFGALYTGCFQHVWFTFMNAHVIDWGENLGIWGHAAETNIPVSFFIKKAEWWTYFDVVSQIGDVMSRLQDPPSDAALAAAKVALNQFAVVPVVYMPLFFALTGVLGGLDWNKGVARAQSLYVPLLQRNYLFWLPMQFIQFLVLPVEWQIPFLCIASFWWTVILSSIGGSTTPSASPSSVLVYETSSTTSNTAPSQEYLTALSGEEPRGEVITVGPVDAGAVNDITDTVLLEDVSDALVPQNVRDAIETVGEAVEDAWTDPSLGASAGGLALGLLAAAADEASIGAVVGGALGAEAQVGVAVLTAMGAGVGYLASASPENDDEAVDEHEEASQDNFGDGNSGTRAASEAA